MRRPQSANAPEQDHTTRREVLPTASHRYQPLTLIFCAAIIGILLDRSLGVSFTCWTLFVILAGTLGLLTHVLNKRLLATTFLLCTIISTFGLWHHDRWNRFDVDEIGFLAQAQAMPIALDATVLAMPHLLPKPPPDPGYVFERTERTILTVRATAVRNRSVWQPVSGKVSLIIQGDRSDLRVRDSIRVLGTFSKPTSPTNSGDVDHAASLRSKRVLCIVRAEVPEAVSVRVFGRPSIARFLEYLRRAAQSNLQSCMDAETAPLAMAMLLGMREGVDDEITEQLFRTGTMHILAISGLHLGLLAASIAFLLDRFGVSRRKIAILLFLTILSYLLLTDVRPPAIRATALISVMSVAVLAGRKSYGVNTLCVTALIVLILNPTELFQFGTQLSFLATGAFLWVPSLKIIERFISALKSGRTNENYDPSTELERLEIKRWAFVSAARRCVEAGIGIFAVSTTIWLASMPLILERFHLWSPISLLVNPLIWLPLALALPCGFVTMLVGNVPVIGTLAGASANLMFRVLFGIIDYFDRLEGYYWMPGPPAWWNLVFYSVLVGLTLFPVRWPSRRILIVLIATWIAVLPAVGYYKDFNRWQKNRLTLTVFSVGHGSCVLVTTPNKKTFVYDVGCISSPRKGAEILSRGLWRIGKRRIDAIILSHSDSDHYNGMIHLVDRFQIGAVFVSPYMFDKDSPSLCLLHQKLREKKIPIYEIGQGDDLAEFGLSSSVFLHPPKSTYVENEHSNACSLVLRMEHCGVGVLLTGDLDGRVPPPFLEQTPLPTSVVMLPHHGGYSSHTQRILEWTSAETLIVSAGHFTYDRKKMDDYRRRGYKVLNTFEQGMIEINLESF